MALTYEPLATTTLSTTTATINFNSISQSYTDLVLVIYARFATGGSNGTIHFQANGDTGNNYSWIYLQGSSGSGANTARSTNTVIGVVGQGGSSSGSDFGIGIAHFMNYSNTNIFKTMFSRATAINAVTQMWGSCWRNKNAITSLKIDGPYSFATGSVFTLYGIKAA